MCLIEKIKLKKLIVLCKDSFCKDDSNLDNKIIIMDFSQQFSNYEIDFKFNLRREQNDESSYGIFALRNLEIMVQQLKNNAVGFIDNFTNFDKFC